MLIGLGFRPLQAAILALIGNTAPVAYGALGIPIITLAKVTGLDAVIRTQVPELPEEISAKYMSPSFFALVYLILVVLPVPFVVTAVTGAIFLLFHESGPEGMQK